MINFNHPLCSGLLLLTVLNGCGGGSSSSATSPVAASPGAAGAGAGVVTQATGRIVLTSVLARAIPGEIDHMVFRGLDASGNAVYGPISRPKAAIITLEGVPVSVRTLEVDYLQGSIVRGRGRQEVVVSASRDALIEDPAFSDVTYDLVQIRVQPQDVELRRGQSQALLVEGSYADNTTSDLSASAQWSSSNTSVAEMVGGNQLLARGVGQCTITSSVGSLNGQANIRVTPPQLQSIQLAPVNATLLEGAQLSYQALGQFADNSVETLSNVSWSSNNPAVASISSQGLAHALTPGNCLIQASAQGVMGNTSLSVAVNQTLTNLTISPAPFQLPKGMSVAYRATASYANGTVVDVTPSASFSTADPAVAKTQGTVGGALPVPPLYSEFALQPPPYFPDPSNWIGAVRQGTTQVMAQFESLAAQVSITVVDPVPLGALVNPVETHLLEVGDGLQFTTLTELTDGSQQTDRADVSVVVSSGNATSLDAQRRATAVRPGIDFVEALVPPLPAPPNADLPVRYSYGPSYTLGSREADYFHYPYEETVTVVNQPRGLKFSAAAEQTGLGTIIEDSPYGLVGANYEPLSAFGTAAQIATPSTTQLQSIAAGNFTDSTPLQVFFAGKRVGTGGVDYGVAVRHTHAFPALPTTTYTEFRDAPSGIADAVVADFDSNGRSDGALLRGQQLLIRLSQTGVLDRLLPPIELGVAAGQVVQADLNEDQKVDLIVGRPDGLQVFLGDGAGGFSPQPLLASPQPLRSGGSHLVVGDIDGDGHLDATYVYSLGQGNRYYAVAYGDGTGKLGRLYYGSTGFRVSATALADVTGDGRADLITVQSKSQRSFATDSDASVSIHPGSAQGFLAQQVIQLSSNSSPADLVVRDVNGDGRLDLTIALTRGVQTPGTSSITYGRSSSLLNLIRQP